MRPRYYTWDGGEVRPVEDSENACITWAKDYEKNGNRVDATHVNGYMVSTVFLGIDYSFDADGRPVLFETMVFGKGGWSALAQRRYSTLEEAKAGHLTVCERVENWRAGTPDEGDEL